MKLKSLFAVIGLALLAGPFAYARGIKDKLTTPVVEDSGNNISVEVKSVGNSASVQGSTVIAGQDTRSYTIWNPDGITPLFVSSGPMGNYETGYAINTSSAPGSVLVLTGDATFYLKMGAAGATNSIRILRSYNK